MADPGTPRRGLPLEHAKAFLDIILGAVIALPMSDLPGVLIKFMEAYKQNPPDFHPRRAVTIDDNRLAECESGSMSRWASLLTHECLGHGEDVILKLEAISLKTGSTESKLSASHENVRS